MNKKSPRQCTYIGGGHNRVEVERLVGDHAVGDLSNSGGGPRLHL